ncbi:Rhamnulose-1-phosphate aldolase [Sedimentisphaera cyanobacteriorum]|uniref:Rhamnulose-1-phosphate aldolase n=1 Tax=Sedimentisphaera cyanobacteriorum TaxID=1940790 RepID=A0A1Q2HPV6_9BACT|nr:rhamnulose-1-phosphate aldolase [Sedimentisphaera cyanobacteriorum]AQQ09400.1 Rhamnulose-1-phosphate aldolase [Sedimentisphaera cyanobacteriorum]
MILENFLTEIKKTTADMWHKGWVEANGGNISVRIDRAVLEEINPCAGKWEELPKKCPNLAGEVFYTPGSGSYIRNVEISPSSNGGLIEISPEGGAYRTLWGFQNGLMPTSELPSHLLTHNEVASGQPGGTRVLIHCHTPNLIALSCAVKLDSNILSKLLWVIQTECLVVFPKGVSFLPWHVPGTNEIGEESAKLLRHRPVLLWEYHGLLAVGNNLDEAFGRIHVAEKTVDIFFKARLCSPKLNYLSDEQLEMLCSRFDCQIDHDIMKTKLPF